MTKLTCTAPMAIGNRGKQERSLKERTWPGQVQCRVRRDYLLWSMAAFHTAAPFSCESTPR
jgi:hypothetical protein